MNCSTHTGYAEVLTTRSPKFSSFFFFFKNLILTPPQSSPLAQKPTSEVSFLTKSLFPTPCPRSQWYHTTGTIPSITSTPQQQGRAATPGLVIFFPYETKYFTVYLRSAKPNLNDCQMLPFLYSTVNSSSCQYNALKARS